MPKLPKKVFLAGIPITIELQPDFAVRTGCQGQSIYAEQKIILDPKATPKESTEACYYHELTHWILFIMNKHELRNDEDFVDTFSHLLYQAEKSAEYEDKRKK